MPTNLPVPASAVDVIGLVKGLKLRHQDATDDGTPLHLRPRTVWAGRDELCDDGHDFATAIADATSMRVHPDAPGFPHIVHACAFDRTGHPVVLTRTEGDLLLRVFDDIPQAQQALWPQLADRHGSHWAFRVS